MRFIKHPALLLLTLAAISLLVPACSDTSPSTPVSKQLKEYDYNVVYDWNETFLEIERYAAGYRPGPAPRALAYIGLANYEACISGMPEFNSIQNLYAGLSIPTIDANQEYHWPSVINASYAYLMRRFFVAATPERQAKINSLEAQYEAKAAAEASPEVIERSRNYGVAVATAVWEYSKTDAIGHDHYLDPFQNYNWEDHFNKDGDWKPTFPGPGKPMGGVWGQARTFAIGDADKLCRAPLPYSANPTSDLYSQALEVYAQNTPTLSYEDEWVGEFWSDDLLDLTFSPGPRWTAIGDQALRLENSNLETAVFLNVKMGMALNDAAVGCWNSKFHYNVERPQTYINRVIDPNWKPALYNPITGDEGVTPSFPAYPSGHSTMGGAGAEVLGSVFGYAYSMTDRCHQTRTEFEGVPRTFGSFYEMADENAWSRVPLGVHFRMDCEEGVRYGTVIGRKVNDLPWKN
jgi:PAP2 superfamily